METLSLAELAGFIRRVFALNLPAAVWVSAELGQVTTSRGHTWLTLVEKEGGGEAIVAQLDAVVWASRLAKLQKAYGLKLVRGVLQQGMSVRLQVTASFHERFGLKLVIEDIDPAHTLGSLEKRRQETLEALHREGLLDRNAQLPVPPVPQRIAVISSDTAAGLADFQRQLKDNRYGYRFKTELYPAAMQGAQTGEEISARLRQIARRKSEYDCIAIVRGGGGKTDLAAFDEYVLCQRVADAPLPVLAGIGHEIDDTVLDRVVHRSLKTPTAVATYLIEKLLEAESHVRYVGQAIQQVVALTVSHETGRLSRLQDGVTRQASIAVQSQRQQTSRLQHELYATAERALNAEALRVDNLITLLDALRPETTLARGYALVSQQGRLITQADQIVPGEVEVRLRSGRITLRKP